MKEWSSTVGRDTLLVEFPWSTAVGWEYHRYTALHSHVWNQPRTRTEVGKIPTTLRSRKVRRFGSCAVNLGTEKKQKHEMLFQWHNALGRTAWMSTKNVHTWNDDSHQTCGTDTVTGSYATQKLPSLRTEVHSQCRLLATWPLPTFDDRTIVARIPDKS